MEPIHAHHANDECSKKTTFGSFFELGGRGAMEALTRTGLDYVIIDTEHGCLSEETVADMILAAENGGLVPYVRIGDIRRSRRSLSKPTTSFHAANLLQKLKHFA